MDFKKWLYNPFVIAGGIMAGAIADNIMNEAWLLIQSLITQTVPQDPITVEQVFRYLAMAVAIILVSLGLYRQKTNLDDQNQELKLDELIKEIKKFIKKWNKGIPFISSGYRKQILERTIWNQNPNKIGKHAIKIKRKAAKVRALNIQNSISLMASLNKIVERIDALGYEVASTVFTLRQEKAENLLYPINSIS